MWIKTHIYLSMHLLPEHINQDIKRRFSKDKYSTVNKTNTGAKEIQQVNLGEPDKQPKHQAHDQCLNSHIPHIQQILHY